MDNNRNHNDESFPLSRIMNIFWHRKWLILFGTLASWTLVALAVLFFPKSYMSSAILSVSEFHRIKRVWEPSSPPPTGLSIPELNNFLLTLRSRNKLDRYLALNGYIDKSEQEIEKFDWNIRPTYAFPEENRRKNDPNFVVSLNVSVDAPNPELATRRTLWISNYCIALLLNYEIQSFFGALELDVETSREVYAKRIYESEKRIEGWRKKERFINEQIFSIKGAEKINELDLSNVTNRTEKYLSPQQQLVAVKIAIKDEEIRIENYKRKIDESDVLSEYLKKVHHLIDEREHYHLREELLDMLMKETDEYFTEERKQIAKGSYFRVAIPLNRFSKLKKVVYRFDTYPSKATLLHKLRRRVIPAFALFFLFIMFLLLAIFLEWIKKNKKLILEDQD